MNYHYLSDWHVPIAIQTWRRLGLCLVPALLILINSLTCYAQSRLYWVQSSATASSDQYASANLDGSNRTTLASGNSTTTFNNPQSLAIDVTSGITYIGDGANTGTTGISSYSLNGSFIKTIVAGTPGISYNALQVVGTKLYWVQSSGTAADDRLCSANLDGSNVQVLASGNSTTTFNNPQSLYVDAVGSVIYVGDGANNGNTGISSYSLNGSFIKTIVAGTPGISYNALQVVGTKLYWVQSSGTAADDRLCSANLDGSNVQVLASGNSTMTFDNPQSLYVDAVGSVIYVGDGANNGNTGISSYSLNGSFIKTIAAGTPGISYNSLATDQTAAVSPTVTTTSPATGISTSGATVGGTITADGGGTLNDYGIVYVQGTGTPTTTNSKVQVGSSSPASFPASFSANLTALSAGTQYTARAYAVNSAGTSYGANVTFTTTPIITVGPSTLPNGTVAVPYSQTIVASGGTSPYAYVITAGALPAGLTLSSAGVLSGTPTAGGAFTFTITATDGGNIAGSRSYSLTLAAPTIVVAPSTLPSGTVDLAYSQTIMASGGNAPYLYAIIAGALPVGLTFSQSVGTLSGTPTSSGTFTFTVRATDASMGSGPYSGSRSYSLTIAAPPITATPSLVTPAANSLLTNRLPMYTGTAPASSTVIVYVNGTSVGTTIATGGSFSLTPTTPLSDGTYTVYATAQSSGQQVSTNSNTNTFTVDATAPVVSSVSVPTAGTYRNGQLLDFTVNFSEAVTVTGNPQLGLAIGSTDRQATYVSGSGSSALTFRYTIVADEQDTDGIALASALTLNGGTIRDGAGNEATLVLSNVPNTTGIQVDAVAPTVVSSVRQSPTAATTNATTLTFRLVFSEPVSGVATTSFLATTTGVIGTISSVAAVNGSPTTYDVTLTGIAGNGTLRLDVKNSGSGITDVAGNPLSGGFTTGETYAIDQTAPSAVLTSTGAASGGDTPNMPIPFTLTFSEPVTGLNASNLSVSNGVIMGFTMNSSSSYSFDVTPQANGLVSVSLTAGVTRDVAGNGNSAVTPYQVTYRPPVTITGFVASESAICVGSSLTLTATVGRDAGTYSYTLTNGDQSFVNNTSNAFRFPLTATGNGTQTFTLRVSNGVDIASQNITVQVNPLPTVSLTGDGPLTCAKPTVTLMATGDGMGQSLTYRFSANASQQGGSSSNRATVTTAGDYSVTAITTSGCSATAQTRVNSDFSLPTPTLLTPQGQSAVTVDLNTAPVTLLVGGCSGTASWTASTGATGMGSTISVPTNQPGQFIYQVRCQVGSCVSNPALATVTVGTRLTVLHRDVDNYTDNNAIQPLLVLQNNSTGSLPLSRLTLRYYLTVENGGTLGNLSLNYAQVGNQNVRLRYVPLNPTQQGATGYVEYSFTEGAGSLAAGANSGPIQGYFTKSDYGPLFEPDDYSYNSVRDQLTGNVRITAYYDGVLVAGIEPGSTAQIRTVRALTESKNGPSATQINTYLEVRNEGNVAINYSDLKARYYFTSDGNERLQVEVDEGNVSTQFVKLAQPVNGADTYLEIRFNQGGQLAPGASTGTIRYRISKPDGGRFNQANDYSYQEQPQDRSQNSRLVVYAGNDVVWGTPPAGAPARLAFAEAGRGLSVTVLGNPIQNDQVLFEVTGVEGQDLQLQLLTSQGRVVKQQLVPRADANQRHQFSVAGQAGGLFLLQVSTPTQSQTVKVIKSN